MRADVDETRASFTSSLYRVTLFEDPAYHSLIEKIITNKSLLLKDFERADTKKSGTELSYSFLDDDDVISLSLVQIIYR